MKLTAKISVAFNCWKCGKKNENDSDFVRLDDGTIFFCDFCDAETKIQFVPVKEKNDD